MDITPDNLDIIWREARLAWQEALAQVPTWWQQIAIQSPSGSRAVDYAWMDRVPQLKKWLGPRVVNSVAAKTRRVVNAPYEETIRLSKWDIEDDQLNVFSQAVRMQAEAAKKWPDTLLAQTIREAASSQTVDGDANLGFDGLPCYSTVHPILGGVSGAAYSITGATTQSNLLLNTPLTYDNYVLGRTTMMSWLGADGLPLNILPNILMVPPQLENMGKSILEADMIATTTATLPGGATQANAPMTNTYKGTATLFVNQQLADKPNNWWLLDCRMTALKPYLFQQRTAPKFTQLTNPNDWNVFNLAEFLYGVEARGATAETVWFLSLAGTSAAAY